MQKYKVPQLNFKRFGPPKGYVVVRHTKQGVKVELSKRAREVIKKRLEKDVDAPGG